ncbi:hypothetical protein E3N88_07692 [Mikania micrantha]|uniref:Ubiquitin-like protease family profile domain-containing protein n=1 Tax=Mikania micrantha TaxID=192012 RepID=A0A5N6PF64_9ASTR|nr:hypothetical protein E3N88_07692 [Mikania micrantha]
MKYPFRNGLGTETAWKLAGNVPLIRKRFRLRFQNDSVPFQSILGRHGRAGGLGWRRGAIVEECPSAGVEQSGGGVDSWSNHNSSDILESSGARTSEGNPLKVDLELTNENNQPIWDETPCTAAKKQIMKKVSFLDKDDVCISMIYTKEEEVVWRYLFKNEIMLYIFETEDGLLAESRMLKSLSVGTQIAADVIDCWAAVLNNEERMAGNEKAKRLFCGPFNPGFYLIDNMDPDETVVSMRDHNDYYKKDTPYKVCKHPMTKELEKATIVRLGLPWATIGNITNCGVFAMRHMEMVRSNCHKAFNCGFSTSQEEQRKQIEALRKKYASRIILSSINKLRMNVIDNACV